MDPQSDRRHRRPLFRLGRNDRTSSPLPPPRPPRARSNGTANLPPAGITDSTRNGSHRSSANGIPHAFYNAPAYDPAPRRARPRGRRNTARSTLPPPSDSPSGTDRTSPSNIMRAQLTPPRTRAQPSPFPASSPSPPGGASSPRSNTHRRARAQTPSPIGGGHGAFDGLRLSPGCSRAAARGPCGGGDGDSRRAWPWSR